MKNVRLPSGTDAGKVLQDEPVKVAVAAAETELKGVGRLLVRKSGTEPLVRVMAEGEDAVLVGRVVDQLVAVIGAAARA